MDLEERAVEPRMGFDTFFHIHFEKVARAASLVTRDASLGQDLAQEAFTRALERWSDMDSDDHARNFVYKVAINLAQVPSAQARPGVPLRAPQPARRGRFEHDGRLR